MIRRTACAALVLALAAVGPARAEAPETVTDLKCLVFAINLSGDPDTTKAGAGAMAALYFMGRIDGREPTMDVGKRINELRLKQSDMAAMSATCGGMLQARGKALAEIGSSAAPKAGEK